MARRALLLLLCLALGGGAAVGPAVAAPAPHPSLPPARAIATADYCAGAEELAFVALINDYRAENGLDPLAVSQTLGAAAEHHSLDMAANDAFSFFHVLSDGTSAFANMTNHGYPEVADRGENIAAGNASAVDVFAQWQASPGHNANMLTPAFHAIGVGRAYNPRSTYGWYWTTTFGGVLDTPVAVCGDPAPSGATMRTTDALRLRAGPSLAADVALVIPAGGAVQVTGAGEGGFAPVVYAGIAGWVAADFLAATPDAVPPPEPGSRWTTMTALNLRAGPSRAATILAVMPTGAAVTATGDTANGFFAVSYDGQDGWASAAYLVARSGDATGDGAIAAADLNLRDGPSLADDVLLVIPAGDPVTVTGAGVNGFLPVAYAGTEGWAAAAYLS